MHFFQHFRDYEITKKDIENIWHPAIEFGHLLRYEKIKVYGGSKSFSFWYGKHWGNYYSEEFQLTFSCRFDFQNYPFDSHEVRPCSLRPCTITRRVIVR